jgi:hypothetical protein
MRSKKALRIALATATIALLSTGAFAQKFEVSPYAGGFFAADYADTGVSLKKEGLYGVRGGYFLTKSLEAEGNFGYMNHFEFEDAGHTKTRAWLWDANATYHFFPSRGKLAPYATGGLGGLTANTVDAGQATLPIGTTGGSVTLKDRDTFLSVNYGGGLKGIRLLGPLGFRADVRGRTLPNFFGRNNTWLETTGGILLSWGER